MTGNVARSADILPADASQSVSVAPDGADWCKLIADAGLNADEIAFLTANKIQGIPQREVAAALGWTQARIERTRKRVDRRLARLRNQEHPELPIHRAPEVEQDAEPEPGGGSSHFFYRERLDCGRWLWALTHSNHLMCPQLAISEGRISKGEFMPTVDIDLAGRLQTARKRLPELMATADDADKRVRSLQADVSGAQAQAKTELEMALIEDRQVNQKFTKEAEAIEVKLRAAMAQRETAQGAVQRTREIIGSLEAEIAAQAAERALAAVKPIFAEICERLVPLRNLALDFRSACDGQLSIWDIQQINQSDPAISYDLAIVQALLQQIGLLAHSYSDWRGVLHIRKVA